MGNTLAIHWAATTYGTWLHGDPRGSWRNGQLIGPDPFLESECRARLTAEAVKLDDEERGIVAVEFGNVVRERSHTILAATIQITHVHIVFAPLRENLDNVIARLKRRSAMGVLARRRAESVSVPRSLWTAGKFPVFIFDDRHLCNAIEYVRAHNRRYGLPDDPYDWITPPDW
jgi:hypothetical protein